MKNFFLFIIGILAISGCTNIHQKTTPEVKSDTPLSCEKQTSGGIDTYFKEMEARWAVQDSTAKTFGLVGRKGKAAMSLLRSNSFSCKLSLLSGLGEDPETNMPIRADIPTVYCTKIRNIPCECKSLRVIISLPPQIVPKTEADYINALEDITLAKENLIYDCSIPGGSI
jgi:hypothetical protein